MTWNSSDYSTLEKQGGRNMTCHIVQKIRQSKLQNCSLKMMQNERKKKKKIIEPNLCKMTMENLNWRYESLFSKIYKVFVYVFLVTCVQKKKDIHLFIYTNEIQKDVDCQDMLNCVLY